MAFVRASCQTKALLNGTIIQIFLKFGVRVQKYFLKGTAMVAVWYACMVFKNGFIIQFEKKNIAMF